MSAATAAKALNALDSVRKTAMRLLEALEAEADELHARRRMCLTPTARGERLPRVAFHLSTRILRNDELQDQVMQMHFQAQQVEHDLLCLVERETYQVGELEDANADALEQANQLQELLREIESTL